MLQVSYIRENKQEVLERLNKKNFNAEALLNEILEIDSLRRKTQNELDSVLNQSNNIAKQIGDLFKAGKAGEANTLKEETAKLKESSRELSEKLGASEQKLNEILVRLPNLPHASVPAGKTPEDNEIVITHGTLPSLPDSALPHWE